MSQTRTWNVICQIFLLASMVLLVAFSMGQRPSFAVVGQIQGCDCHALINRSWTQIANMTTCRHWVQGVSMSVADSEELFHIPGGVGIASVDSFNGYTWNQTQVSNLPDTFYGYCLVKINSSSLLLIGGSHKSDPYGVRSSTYFHDSISNTWRSGPNLQLPRMFHACAVLNWKNESSQKLERTVLVAGGYYGAALTSVELLHLTSLDANLTWVWGSDLPKGSQFSAMVEYQNSVILVGGEGGIDGQEMYQLSSPDGPWVEMQQTLKEGRTKHVAFLIPDQIVDCH